MGMLPLADCSDGKQSLWGLCRGDHYPSWLDNTSLLGGNLGQRVPKDLHMIVANGGDDRDERLDHIGSVQASSQANFQHSMINMLATEIEEGQCRSDFIGDKWAKFPLLLYTLNHGTYFC